MLIEMLSVQQLGMAENKYNILAISLGTALIEEAFSKSFDQNTTDGNVG